MKNILLFIFIGLVACSDNENNPQGNEETTTDWLIPSDEVLDGGPGKDGIPSIDSPNFSKISDINFLEDNDLVVGVVHKGTVKAYPHAILNWHEIVNDEIDDLYLAITYCPLTGTAIIWDRTIDGNVTTFGVSGKLYNTNLMPYDRASDSYWSQIALECVHGNNIGQEATTIHVIETTWATWKKAYPDSDIMNTDTGFSRNYSRFPYNDYITNNDFILFPLDNTDDRLPAKERVLGVLGKETERAYQLSAFKTGKAITDQLDDQDIIIVGSENENYVVAFEKGQLGEIEYVANALPVIAEDDNGNRIQMNGEITRGPLSGTRLSPTRSFIGYWLSFGAFYEEIEIYE